MMEWEEATEGLSRSELAALKAEAELLLSQSSIEDYRPFPKQLEFHAAGAEFRERLFMAGNQLGKTVAGGAECAYHATGDYPDWWEGRVFDHGINAWVGGVTGELTRDGPQRIVLGQPGAWGTGSIPYKRIKDIQRKSHGVKDAVETLIISHGGGADVQMQESRIGFKSYDQGRKKFQAETLDFVWFDEEPPIDVYIEGLTRTNNGDRGRMGMVYQTFTPLMGMSQVVERFLLEQVAGSVIIQMGIADAFQYTEEQRAVIIAAYPAHEREARANGTPAFGSGKVFPVSEETITIASETVLPSHWPAIIGMDFGWDHPSAAIKMRLDRDDDVLIVVGVHRMREATPLIFAEGIKPWGVWCPVAWPHDGLQHDKGSGDELAELYRRQGMNMLPKPASFNDDTLDNSVEAGIAGMLDYMVAGRFKVLAHLTEWFEEFRTYHRQEGIIVKKRDDLMSATRMAYMMRRHARTKPRGSAGPVKPPNWRTA
jgi:phage terminase large subunit-like protein